MTSERVDVSAPIGAAKAPVVVDDLQVVHHLPARGVRSWYRRLHERRRLWMAIRGFREVLLVVGVYSLYDATRFLVAGKSSEAFANGRSILHYEKVIGLAPEHWLNKLFSAHIVLGLTADYMYATLHYLVTPLVLVWMWRRHGSAYSQARSVLLVTTVLGLVGFSLLPVAPPRLLPEFIDTMAKFSHYGWWGTAASAPRGLGGDTNQFAALPSLHVGWALWCGWQLARYGRHRLTQVLGVLYPFVVAIVVMSTANHYLVDVLAGVVTMSLAVGIVRLLTLAGLVMPPGAEAPGVPAGAEPTAT
jgi:hypothetical protein